MAGTYARDWKPRNLGGEIFYDPRRELAYWAMRGRELGLEATVIPIATLAAVAELRECRSSVISRGDEDGPMPPARLWCRQPEDHRGDHSNGYTSWREERAEQLPLVDGTCGRTEDHLAHGIPVTMRCLGVGEQKCRPDEYQHLGPWEHVKGSDSLNRCEACGMVIGK